MVFAHKLVIDPVNNGKICPEAGAETSTFSHPRIDGQKISRGHAVLARTFNHIHIQRAMRQQGRVTFMGHADPASADIHPVFTGQIGGKFAMR